MVQIFLTYLNNLISLNDSNDWNSRITPNRSESHNDPAIEQSQQSQQS